MIGVPFLSMEPNRGNWGDDTGVLRCPLCEGEYIHIENAYIAGRIHGEDSEVVTARIDSRANLYHESVPISSSRRQSFGLGGYCEMCGEGFIIEFSQHKGETFVGIIKTTNG